MSFTSFILLLIKKFTLTGFILFTLCSLKPASEQGYRREKEDTVIKAEENMIIL